MIKQLKSTRLLSFVFYSLVSLIFYFLISEATRLKKEELKKLTAAEEASQPTKVPKAVKKVPAPPKPSASLSSKIPDFNSGGGSGKDLGNDEIESFSASNIVSVLEEGQQEN